MSWFNGSRSEEAVNGSSSSYFSFPTTSLKSFYFNGSTGSSDSSPPMADDYSLNPVSQTSLNLFRARKLNRRSRKRKSKKKRKCKKRKKCSKKKRRSKRRRSKKKKGKKGKPAWRNKVVRPKLVDERFLLEPEKPIIDNRMNHHAFEQQTEKQIKRVNKGKGGQREEGEKETIPWTKAFAFAFEQQTLRKKPKTE